MKLNAAIIHRQAKRMGFIIRKSKDEVSMENYGGYMLVDGGSNIIVLGSKFEATLEDVAEYLKKLSQ